jgi:RimJ/RimL family protein N-acetyltransferase
MTRSRGQISVNRWRDLIPGRHMDIIHSPRLELIALSPDFLSASLGDDLESAARLLNLSIPQDWLEAKWLMELRLAKIRANPALEPWLLRAVGLRETRTMIGFIGFHTLPGAEYLNSYAPGSVEFGYTIFPEYRQKGYASEAAQALMDWATREHEVRRFVVSISPANEPSLRLARKFGFRKVGSVTDPEDGVEDIFLLDINASPNADA